VPIVTGKRSQRRQLTRAEKLYDLVVDGVQGFTLAEVMAVKRGDEWEELPPSVRTVFEEIAHKLDS